MVSIVINTYNRCVSLARTLESLTEMKPLPEGEWEVVVVDNNSTDDTRKTVESFMGRLPLWYFFEGTQGIAFAKNRGVQEAKGDIIATTDDDVIVDKLWLVNIEKAFGELDAACIGGKILPIWEVPPPKWVSKELCGVLALLDHGNERVAMQRPRLWGANLCYKAVMFEKYGLFNTRLDRLLNKSYHMCGEEVDFVERLLGYDEKVFYCPEILVHHCIPAHRLQKQYFRKWHFDSYEKESILLGDYSERNIYGIPLYAIKQIIYTLALLLKGSLLRQDDRFLNELKFYEALGFISGRLKYMRANRL